MTKKRIKVKTFKEFHRLVPNIVKKICQNKDLSMRALVNPLLAIEELGYDISEYVKKQVEMYLRFTHKEQKQLVELEKHVEKQIGRKINLDSDEEIENLLFKELKLSSPRKLKIHHREDVCEKGASLIMKKEMVEKDALETLKGKHPVIDPLLEYRKIAHKRAPFAPKELYNQLKKGERKLPVSGVRIKFQHDTRQQRKVDNA